MNSLGDKIWRKLWQMPKDTAVTLQCNPRHRWLHHCLPKTPKKSPQYCWTPTSHSAYKIIPGRMVKNEGKQLSQHIRPTLWTPQRMFTFAFPFIFWSLTFPYPLHNRIWEREASKYERKGECEHALRCPECRPDILTELRSFIFDHPSWNIFVGTMDCGGSTILGALLRSFR